MIKRVYEDRSLFIATSTTGGRHAPGRRCFRACETAEADLHGDLRSQALAQYLDAQPEKALLGFVQAETAMWLEAIEPEECDKYVVMAALNLVSCIAYVPLQE